MAPSTSGRELVFFSKKKFLWSRRPVYFFNSDVLFRMWVGGSLHATSETCGVVSHHRHPVVYILLLWRRKRKRCGTTNSGVNWQFLIDCVTIHPATLTRRFLFYSVATYELSKWQTVCPVGTFEAEWTVTRDSSFAMKKKPQHTIPSCSGRLQWTSTRLITVR